MHARLIAPLAIAALVATPRSPYPPRVRTPLHRPPRLAATTATSTGLGGAVSTVDTAATKVGLRVLKKGGNAVDAAIATAAALGVTEPYSSGIGGGGYFVFYNAEKGKVQTIDGREKAPAGIKPDAFIDPATGKPYNFTPELVTSGVSVGVPGTPATWDKALRRWGTWRLDQALKPAIKLADRGFIVDPTFRLQTAENQKRFEAFPSTSEIYLPGGQPPAVGSVLKNPDLADTYRLLADKGVKKFYQGKLAGEISRTVQKPPKTATTTLPVPAGSMTTADLNGYRAVNRKPTSVGYRGYDVFGMAPSSSGGSTVGEALNIMERYDLGAMTDTNALHHYLEASALAFADRGAYVGDPNKVDVPLSALLDDTFAAERACKISETTAATKPVAAGNPAAYDGSCATPAPGASRDDADTENISTTNLTVSDRWGNVVEYTLTIEQTGGSGIVVPGRGFILNNELTDFSTVYSASDPNRIQPGKRPRSSMSPTIVLEGRRALARARLARRLDHHHHGAADAVQPHRPRDDDRAGHRGAPRLAAQHGLGHGGAVVHRRVRRAAGRARPQVRRRRCARDVGRRDRCRDRDRVPRQRPGRRRRRARPPRWRRRRRGGAEVGASAAG